MTTRAGKLLAASAVHVDDSAGTEDSTRRSGTPRGHGSTAVEGGLASDIDYVVGEALAEDIGVGDLTTEAAIDSNATCNALLVVKEEGVLCGLEVARSTFDALDPKIRFASTLADGQRITNPPTTVARIRGPASGILTGERTTLNFLGRLSGIASLTRRFVDAIDGTGAAILDTRKTTPGLRALEKYAVRCGGGQNHRFGLYDAVLIKDNHIQLAGGLAAAVERVRQHSPGARIEVEVESLTELREALALGVARVMLDNMPLDQIVEAVTVVDGRIELEASGGISLGNVRAIAESGVDFLSVGALTRAANSLDASLEVV